MATVGPRERPIRIARSDLGKKPALPLQHRRVMHPRNGAERRRFPSPAPLPEAKPCLPAFLDVRHYFAYLDTAKGDRFIDHLRHLIRGCPRSVL